MTDPIPNDDETPESQTRWQHRNGNFYTVLGTANAFSTDRASYPVMVVYQGDNGRIWARRADDWHRSFVPVVNAELPELTDDEYRVMIDAKQHELRAQAELAAEPTFDLTPQPKPEPDEPVDYHPAQWHAKVWANHTTHQRIEQLLTGHAPVYRCYATAGHHHSGLYFGESGTYAEAMAKCAARHAASMKEPNDD